jgi:hypothetical protein
LLEPVRFPEPQELVLCEGVVVEVVEVVGVQTRVHMPDHQPVPGDEILEVIADPLPNQEPLPGRGNRTLPLLATSARRQKNVPVGIP